MEEGELLKRCFSQPLSTLKPLLEEAYRISRSHFLNTIHFYLPSMVHYDTPSYQATNPHRFTAVSITGKYCRLNCEHCRGRLLEDMIPATTPQDLFKVCVRVKEAGGRGCLISGGSLREGGVPLENFLPMIKWIREELGLKVVVHTGLIDSSLAEELADAGVDAAMIDVIGSDETVEEVYHLKRDVGSFDQSLTLLEEKRIPMVPHIVVGIHYGRLKGEEKAVRIISRYRPAAVVVVALMPLEGTPMAHTPPPSPIDITRVILASRLLMPHTPLLLGCGRPRGIHGIKTDILAIKAGVNGVAYPSEEAHRVAKRLGLDVKFHEECCSLLWEEFPSTLAEQVQAPTPG